MEMENINLSKITHTETNLHVKKKLNLTCGNQSQSRFYKCKLREKISLTRAAVLSFLKNLEITDREFICKDKIICTI